MVKLDSKIPEGPVENKWSNYKAKQNLVTVNKTRVSLLGFYQSKCEAKK